MRLHHFLIFIVLIFAYTAQAQTSQRGFSFQGYAVGSSGVVLSDSHLDVKFTIYPKKGVGYTYEETQSVITDFYGVFSAVIGEGSVSDFQRMNFTAKGVEYWMKVEIKKLGDLLFHVISDQALLAVPYAKFAENGVPVGTIIPFAAGSTKVPDGWLVCDGTQLDGTDPKFEQLFNVIGNTWGGSGTAFHVPDLRGYFLRGVDGGTGVDPNAASRTALVAGGATGDNVGSYQTDAAGPHNHAFSGTTNTTGSHSHSLPEAAMNFSGGASSSSYNGGDGEGRAINGTNSAGNHSHTFSGTTDNNAGVETRPKNAYVLYIIKY